MKKNSILAIAIMVLLLAAITLITVNTKKIHAESVDNQTPTTYKIGDVVTDFNLKNIDGAAVSMASMNTNGVILVFTCNHCPYAKAYESRIIAMDKKNKALGYPVIAINPNALGENGEDGIEENKKAAIEKGFVFPYLKDDTQKVTAQFGARRTPSAYILKKENDQFILKYAGAIDDNSQSAEAVTKNYIDLAIAELLLGKNVTVNTTKSIGCGIKFKGV
jgi:peroxiredoxin